LRIDNEHDDEEAIAAEEAEEAEEAVAEELEGEEAAVPVVESMSVAEPLELPKPSPAPSPAPSAEPPQGLPPPIMATVRPIVDWPPEDQRKLVSLRLVARPPERFRGNLVRQALAAEGFVLADLDIFHKPDAHNRAVLSAASLTKPGTFDLETMDTQRYVGLNLFAVLPGPKTPQKAFEDLLLTARTLNERLEGALQDERGGPLTPTRIQALRDALGVEAKS
jgi:cell division protein ZipA